MFRANHNNKKDMIFQYMSDLHIENNMNKPLPFVKKVDENVVGCLILAGDIGDPNTKQFWNFIKQECDEFDVVLFVCGNHEFYGKSIKQTLDFFKDMKQHMRLTNFFVLDNDVFEFDNCSVIGSTLWTYTPSEAINEVLSCINDYKFIEDFKTKNEDGVNKRNDAWFQNACFIQKQIENIKKTKPSNHKIIVVTHHAPELENTSHPRYVNNILNCNFACDLRLIVNKVDHWIFGHTHFIGMNGNPGTFRTKLKSNQVGYHWDRPLKFFDIYKHFRI